MDTYGHINNAAFLTLYEEARVALFFLGASEKGVTSFEEGIVISRHEVDYLRPVSYGTGPDGKPRPPMVRIELWVDEIRPSRLVVAYELFDGSTLASRARSVCVPYDMEAQRPRRLSELERTLLAEWVPTQGELATEASDE